MADKKKAYRYFTFIIYPGEFPSYLIKELVPLGVMMISPLHTPSCEKVNFSESPSGSLRVIGTDLSMFIDDDLKDHYHVIVKSTNKITEISFMQKVCDLLHNDLRGISVNPTDCGVADPSMLIRYFYHLDHPHKQQFDFHLDTLDVPKVFFEECKKAFSVELCMIIQKEFVMCDCLNSLYSHINTHCSPFISWIFWNSKNTYLISQLYKEQREMERSR